MPTTMTVSRPEFEQLVANSFAAIPEKFRMRIKNLAFVVEDEPTKEVREREGLSLHETLLGYYQGIPATARGSEYGVGPTLPDTIIVYQLPCEQESEWSHVPLADVVRDTVFHEVAHYLGMDEREVESWEKEKGTPGKNKTA